MIRHLLLALTILIAASAGIAPASADRIKDLGGFQGIRSNQLTGYGVVVGLPGTGDDNLEYTVQSLKAATSRFGLQLPPNVNPAMKNAAVVMVTADLPPFAKPGQRIDITVASMGRAKSLRGGSLIMMPLMGADGQIYAMAQGNLAVGGLGAEGADGSKIVVNVPSTGRIPEGA
ncbi:MAG: flagellar biosynthesis protein FlgI, partial [Sphingomonas sp.]